MFLQKLIDKIRQQKTIQRHLWLRQFIKFSIAGGTCMMLDFLIYILLTRLSLFWSSHLWLSNFIAICFSATINYTWNKNWTFRSQNQNNNFQYLKFWAVVILGIILYQWIFIFLINFHTYDLLAKAIAAATVWVIRFIFNKIWTFK